MNFSVKQINCSLFVMLVLAGIAGSAMLVPRHSTNGPIKSASISGRPAAEAYGQIPLSFEANQGQTESSVDYLARGAGYTLFLKPTEAVFILTQKSDRLRARNMAAQSSAKEIQMTGATDDNSSDASPEPMRVLRMKLVGAAPVAAVHNTSELPGKVNYFTGPDPDLWRHDIPTYARVSYREVYPGIDVVYFGNQRQLEYDFVVAPGGNASVVKLQFAGADKVEVNAAGELLLSVGESVIRQPKPLVYQDLGGERQVVEGGYAVGTDGQVGFAIGDYDPAHPLVIDPVLVYSTYLGGNGNDSVRDITLDSSGNVYMCGGTTSTNFPTANAFDSTFNTGNIAADRDAFVTKLNAAGTALVYSSYLGGTGTSVNLSGDDVCTGIAIDSTGNAYLAGETRSTDFPLANAFDATFGGLFEGYLTKLNVAGNALVYSTYIGGDVFDSANGVAVDSSNNAYVAGRTTSSNFPTVNPIQATFAGGGSDAFIMKFNAAGSALVYSTYLGGGGGNGFDAAFGIALDPANNAYITGPTLSTDFPTANAIQATFGGGTNGDGYVAKINAAGSALVYSTYLGGSSSDLPQHIDADSSGNAYVTGGTESTNFPTANAFDSTLTGTSDAFVTKINAGGSAFVYSTYLGGGAGDGGNDIRVDSSGRAHVAGFTASTDFPTVNPTQAANGGGSNDAFVMKFNAAGSALLFSSYLGGSGVDSGFALAVDSAANIYVAGITTSTNFPTLNPVQAANGGGEDAFVTKISDPPLGTVQFSTAAYAVTEDVTQVLITLTRSGDLTAAATADFVTSDGTALQRTDYIIGAGTVRWAAGDGASKTFGVLISEDAYVEGPEGFTLTLSNPTGATLGVQSSATLTINDDDITNPPTVNPIEDTNIFVRQHYHDMLAREGDSGGVAYWTNEINMCGGNTTCIRLRRVGVSGAFFFEPEYQETAAYLYRVYKASFNTNPSYTPFMRDRSRLVGSPMLSAEKTAFTEAFVLRAEFIALFPLSLTPAQYVDALNTNTGNSLMTAERDALVNGLIAATETRGSVLRKVAENAAFIDREYNNAFVANLYFSYLRRDAEPGGYAFWLGQINSFPLRSVSGQQAVLCSFLTSQEYQERFSSVVTRTNAECGP